MPLIASIYLVLQVFLVFFLSYYMRVMNILTPDDGNELLDKCSNKQISLITFSYIDTWEAMQEDAVRVIQLINS